MFLWDWTEFFGVRTKSNREIIRGKGGGSMSTEGY